MDGKGGKGREEGRVREGVHNLRKTTPVIRWLVTGLGFLISAIITNNSDTST